MELGPMGMTPWGNVDKPTREPDVFCDFNVVSILLGKLGVPPDFESEGSLRYTHRRTKEADIYFVANRDDSRVEASCTFRVSGKAPELWDPLTGQTRDLPEFTSHDGRTTVPVRFEPAQSFFVLFRKPLAEGKAAGREAIAKAGDRSSSDGSFPLTPALSPEDREKRRQTGDAPPSPLGRGLG